MNVKTEKFIIKTKLCELANQSFHRIYHATDNGLFETPLHQQIYKYVLENDKDLFIVNKDKYLFLYCQGIYNFLSTAEEKIDVNLLLDCDFVLFANRKKLYTTDRFEKYVKKFPVPQMAAKEFEYLVNSIYGGLDDNNS